MLTIVVNPPTTNMIYIKVFAKIPTMVYSARDC